MYCIDWRNQAVHPSTSGRSAEVSYVEEGDFVYGNTRKDRFARNIKGPMSINFKPSVSTANINGTINISTDSEQPSLRLSLIVQINTGYLSVTSELEVMYWVTYEKRASGISHAPYTGYSTWPAIFTHARRRRRHDARGEKHRLFSFT